MEDLFKKFIYTGVGWISSTTEKFKKTIDEFIQDGKISASEGKKLIDEFIKNSDAKKDELEDQFNTVIDKLLGSFKFAKSEDLGKLEKRIKDLETLLKKASKKAKEEPKKSAAKTSKKAASKKKTGK